MEGQRIPLGNIFYMLPLEIRNVQSAKSVIISKLIIVHYTKCSMDSVSSASSERIFSNFVNIHTKVHNLLCNSKAFKMVFCYRILRGSAELDYLTVQIDNIHFVCRRTINVIILLYSYYSCRHSCVKY